MLNYFTSSFTRSAESAPAKTANGACLCWAPCCCVCCTDHPDIVLPNFAAYHVGLSARFVAMKRIDSPTAVTRKPCFPRIQPGSSNSPPLHTVRKHSTGNWQCRWSMRPRPSPGQHILLRHTNNIWLRLRSEWQHQHCQGKQWP